MIRFLQLDTKLLSVKELQIELRARYAAPGQAVGVRRIAGGLTRLLDELLQEGLSANSSVMIFQQTKFVESLKKKYRSTSSA